MSVRTNATSNPILTNYAQGLAPTLTSADAEFLAPTVRVASTLGHYKQYDAKNLFQNPPTARAIGGAAHRIEFASSDPTYNCKPQALEIVIDDAERDAAGDADPLLLEQAKTRTLVTSAMRGHVNAVITAATGGVTAVASRGEWSSSSVNPIDQIDEQIKALVTATGMMPNRILFGLSAWTAFRSHPKVTARLSGVRIPSIQNSDVAGLLLNQGVEVRVSAIAKDTTLFPKAQSNSLILDADVFIFIASQSPDTYDPSFMKTFMGGAGGVDSVRMYRDERSRGDVLAVDWSEDVKITASTCVKRLTIT